MKNLITFIAATAIFFSLSALPTQTIMMAGLSTPFIMFRSLILRP